MLTGADHSGFVTVILNATRIVCSIISSTTKRQRSRNAGGEDQQSASNHHTSASPQRGGLAALPHTLTSPPRSPRTKPDLDFVVCEVRDRPPSLPLLTPRLVAGFCIPWIGPK